MKRRADSGTRIFQGEKDEFGTECAAILPKGMAMEQERRRSPRFPFIASAKVLTESAGTRLAARISDLSATGCYVDTINPLMDGTPVRLKILAEACVIGAHATVVYSHAHLGMGLMFGEVLGNSQNLLQNGLPVAS
jgi:PilZ domain